MSVGESSPAGSTRTCSWPACSGWPAGTEEAEDKCTSVAAPVPTWGFQTGEWRPPDSAVCLITPRVHSNHQQCNLFWLRLHYSRPELHSRWPRKAFSSERLSVQTWRGVIQCAALSSRHKRCVEIKFKAQNFRCRFFFFRRSLSIEARVTFSQRGGGSLRRTGEGRETMINTQI